MQQSSRYQVFSKEYINLLLSGYFFLLGVLAVTHILSSFIGRFLPASFPRIPFHLHFMREEDEDGNAAVEYINFKFDTKDLLSFAFASVLGVWYLTKKVHL